MEYIGGLEPMAGPAPVLEHSISTEETAAYLLQSWTRLKRRPALAKPDRLPGSAVNWRLITIRRPVHLEQTSPLRSRLSTRQYEQPARALEVHRVPHRSCPVTNSQYAIPRWRLQDRGTWSEGWRFGRNPNLRPNYWSGRARMVRGCSRPRFVAPDDPLSAASWCLAKPTLDSRVDVTEEKNGKKPLRGERA